MSGKNRYLTPFLLADLFVLLLTATFLLLLPARLFRTPTSYVLEASNGTLLSAAIASDGQWRFPQADTVPEKFTDCILVFEDKRFFQHPGVDLLALSRAMKQNFNAKSIVSGGSTLSMQTIRLSRRKERTVWQKIYEIILAVRLEISYSKLEILQLYASNAPFGSNVVGLEAAAWRYYGRSPQTLSWGEMATLAVLPNSPSLVHPGKNSARLITKRNNLLDALVSAGKLDRASADLAKLEPIPAQPRPLPQEAPHLLNRFRTANSRAGNYSTRLHSTLQEDLQIRLNGMLKRYQNRYRANDINNIAALVLDVKKGTVIAYAGNIYQPDNAEMESHVDMIRAPRSPGSTLKPILYASMLTEGYLLPQTLIPDIPTQIGNYNPQNYDLGYDGAIPANQALSRSLNIPAVRMLQTYKYPRFYDQLKKLGLSTLSQPADHYGLSLILGGSEVTAWDLSTIYLGMARSLNHYNDYSGKYNPYDYQEPVYNQQQALIKPRESELLQSNLLNNGAIWNTFNAMEELMRPGEEGLWEQFSSSRRVAWKTGTSFGFRDGWAVGLNPDYVICVWVGNADGEGRPGLTGVEVAAPVLFDIFKLLPAGKWFVKPAHQLSQIRVCRQSGFKAGPYCPDIKIEETSPSGEKTSPCPYHKMIHLDPSGNYRVTDLCVTPSEMQHKSWFILPPAMEYYYRIKHSDYRSLPAWMPGCLDAGQNSVMDMIYPKSGAVVYIPLEFNGERGKVIFTATHRNPEAKIFWHIDQEFVGETQFNHQLSTSPSPGKHTLTLVDENGERLVQNFTVLPQEKRK